MAFNLLRNALVVVVLVLPMARARAMAMGAVHPMEHDAQTASNSVSIPNTAHAEISLHHKGSETTTLPMRSLPYLSHTHHERMLRPRGKDEEDEAADVTTVEFEVELVLDGISCDTVEILVVQGIAAGSSADIILGRIVCTALEDELEESGDFPLSLLDGCQAEGTTLTTTCPNLLVVVEDVESRVDEEDIRPEKDPKTKKGDNEEEEVPEVNNWGDALELLITTWSEVREEEVASGQHVPIQTSNDIGPMGAYQGEEVEGTTELGAPVRRYLRRSLEDVDNTEEEGADVANTDGDDTDATTETDSLTFQGKIVLEAIAEVDGEGETDAADVQQVQTVAAVFATAIANVFAGAGTASDGTTFGNTRQIGRAHV